jgi:hypothetical protein
MSKYKLELINDPYNNYGILTEDHLEETALLAKFFKTNEYIDLYNKCLVDIAKNIYQGKIEIKNDVLRVKLDPSYIKKMTRSDLKIIQNIGHKLHTKLSYGNLKDFYTIDQYPLSPIEKLTNEKLKCAINKSYPTTHYEFFKYEDFDTFNWIVYYKYISNKYKDTLLNDAPSFSLIESRLGIFNKLILELKMAFNRLRPLQSSFIEQIPIKTYITYAGQTPAIPSGHSSQGFLFGALVYSQLKTYFDLLNKIDKSLFEKELYLLVRVCKDTGHRRIMAGIHYPSDMLASWIIFKHIIIYLNIEDEVIPYYEKLKSELDMF